jgi:hypothetical protein
VDTYISALNARLRELADSSLQNPQKDLFDHGFAAGKYAGIQEAMDMFYEAHAPKAAAQQPRSAVYS